MKLTPCCCCWRVCTNVLPLNNTQKSAQERKRETRLRHQNSLASERRDDDARAKQRRSQEKQQSAEFGERGSERNQRVSNFWRQRSHFGYILLPIFQGPIVGRLFLFLITSGYYFGRNSLGGVETSHVINIKFFWVTRLGYQKLGNTHLLHKGELSNNWLIFAYYSCWRFFEIEIKIIFFVLVLKDW